MVGQGGQEAFAFLRFGGLSSTLRAGGKADGYGAFDMFDGAEISKRGCPLLLLYERQGNSRAKSF